MLKHFRSLMLACMAFCATAAFAGDWTVPAPKGSEFAVGEKLYMYNVGGQGFINQGEAWGTQAVINKTAGLVFKWEVSSENPLICWAWNNNSKSDKYMKRVNSDDKAGKGARTCFVDGKKGNSNRSRFVITSVGNNKYTIQMAAEDGDPEVKTEGDGGGYDAAWYIGIQTDYPGSLFYQNEGVTYALWYDLAYEGNTNCEWLFVSEADYKICAAKGELVEKMNEAEEGGIDVSAAEAVLNNPDATLEDVKAAITALVNAIASNVTPDDPVDKTDLIKNPYLNENHNGWESTMISQEAYDKIEKDGPIQNNKLATNRCTDGNADGVFDGQFWENWNEVPMKGKMHQEVKDLPNGVYSVSLAAFVNHLDEDNAVTKNQYVFFNDTKCPMISTDNKKYSATIAILDGVLDLGLAIDEFGACNWAGIDNARLLFYGSGLESFKYPATELRNNLETVIEGIVNGREMDGYYTESYYEAFNAAVDAVEAAASKEEAAALLAPVTAAYELLLQNVALWCQLKDVRDAVENGIFEEGLALDELLAELEDLLEERPLTNEELEAKIAEAKKAILVAKASAYKEGDEVADIFIQNAGFKDDSGTASIQGWTKVKGNFGGGNSGVIEAWNNSFEIYQDLKGLQNGAYEISLQAYFRAGDSGSAYEKWAADDQTVESYVYAGDNEAPFANIFSWGLADAGDGGWTGPHEDGQMRPNDVTSANWAFNHADAPYQVKVIGVVTDGTLRVGLKNTSASDYHQWSLWNGLKMTYLAFNADLIRPALEALISSVSIADAPMYSAHKAALDEALKAAEAAANGSDGQAMMAAYKTLSAAVKQAEPSVAAYKTLAAAKEKLDAAYAQYGATAVPETAAEAQALIKEIEGVIANGKWTVEEAEAQTKAALSLAARLRIPNGAEASDEHPIDFTVVLANPDITEGVEDITKGINGVPAGWTAPDAPNDWHFGQQFNIMEGFECTFECYQDLEGLPEGTYEIQCKGFFRDMDSDHANAAFLGDSTQIRGKLFAEATDMIRQEKSLCNLIQIDDACLSAPGAENNWKTINYATAEDVDSVMYYYPNMREAARDRFDSGLYNNSMYVKVAADGKLRLGFCNMGHKKNDWTATSNYKLYYFGKNSSKEVNNDVDAINTAAVETVVTKAIYSIDGRKLDVLQKGINIVRFTDANGKVVVKKIMVK